jgi:hypothetical protein
MSDVAEYISDTLRRQAGHDPGTVSTQHDGVSIEVEVDAAERYASGVRGITVRPDRSSGSVRDVAERIVDQVDALDPLAIVECDDEQGRAIVRSAEPEQSTEGVTYWEADVQPDATSLHRYHKSHATPEREQIAEPLLHPTVGRVAEQLADAVREQGTENRGQ